MNFCKKTGRREIMWLKRTILGIIIGVLLCSVIVNAGEREQGRREPPTIMERICDIPRKIYGKKKCRNKIRKSTGKFRLPPDARIGDIIKTKRGYKQITDIWGNGQFRWKPLRRKYFRKEKKRVKRRYNQKIRDY